MELKCYLNRQNAPSSAKRYYREIELFILSLEKQNINPKTANYSQIMEYIGKLRDKQNNLSCSLHGIKKYYSYLVATGIRKDNPAKSIRLRDKRSRDIQLQDLFKTEELEQLLDRKERYVVLKNRNKIVISLLIYQGLTNGEIKKLELKDLDLEQGTIYIKPGRKTNKRTLKLQSKQVFWIMKYLQEDRPKLLKIESQKLIISKLGTEETGEGIGYIIETCRYLFPNRKLNAKTIRQSVIANLLKQGKDLRLVQAFAGHKYPSTTEMYKQTQVEELKNQILKYHPLK
ncbi:tyrosine-type recombinase/integrase [Tenacibaculum maritimum]|uniref:tyrosine-type recombinase/integrase n=1 Tax=Tenacibaculum maritimum TaxID=107401 RepID=UPI0012E40D37|nr:tyrosine-type recombinase/integrase [Tenacibaculum maritimum]CAA0202547.1 Integrase [Tenacibaculum maritimum]CAA0251861.1 Integrase/recombinase XerD family [Tenacibaculum maritimum]